MILFILTYILGYIVMLYICLRFKLKEEGYIDLGNLVASLLLALFSWLGAIIWILMDKLDWNMIIYKPKKKR